MQGLGRVRLLAVLTSSYFLFWGPLFAVTLWNWGWTWEQAKLSTAHEVRMSFCNLVL